MQLKENRDIKLSLVKGTSANIVGMTTLFSLLKNITTDESMKEMGKELKCLYLNDNKKYKLKKDFQNGFIIGEFSYRNIDSCLEYFPYLGFDIDKVKEESEKERIISILKEWEYSFLVMPSISGLGIRLIVICDCSKEDHRRYYNQLCQKISKIIGIPLKSKLKEAFKQLGYSGKKLNSEVEKNAHFDDSMSDISRFWFYSGLDRSDIYLNQKSKVYSFEEPKEEIEVKQDKVYRKVGNSKYEYEFTQSEKVEYLIDVIERNNIDITTGIRDWFKVGLALAHEFGEMGREYFYRVSKFHPDFDLTKSKNEYNRCLRKSKSGKVTIGSFYAYCEDFGVGFDWKELIKRHQDKFPKQQKNNPPQKSLVKSNPSNQQKNAFFFPEAEKAIIGASLIDSFLLQEIYDHCPKFSHECFVDADCKLIFKTIQSLFANGLDINVVSVNAKVQKFSIDYLNSFSQGQIFKEHIKTSVEIVYQSFLKRRLLDIANECVAEISNSDYDVFNYVDTVSSKLNSLGDYGHSKNEDTSESAAGKVAERLTKLQKHFLETGGLGLTGVPTGIIKEDDFTAGFQDQDLIILAARPGMGKTAKILKTLLEASRQGFPVGMFSLEMSNTQLMTRLLAMESQIPSEKLKKGGMSDLEVHLANQTLLKLAEMPFYLDDTAGVSPSYILRQATKWKRKYGIKLLIVDYLQLMNDGGQYKGNKVQQITEISRQLKLIAKNINVPVIALSQLSRAVETRGGTKRPQLSDLRESGAIEQDADIVTFIYRPEYYNILEDEQGYDLRGVAELIYAKHRNGELGSVFCNFDSTTVSFYDSDKYQPDIV